jgi:hypothetical protein
MENPSAVTPIRHLELALKNAGERGSNFVDFPQGYPSKFLITPQGKYLIVPYGIDWVNFVKQYSNL